MITVKCSPGRILRLLVLMSALIMIALPADSFAANPCLRKIKKRDRFAAKEARLRAVIVRFDDQVVRLNEWANTKRERFGEIVAKKQEQLDTVQEQCNACNSDPNNPEHARFRNSCYRALVLQDLIERLGERLGLFDERVARRIAQKMERKDKLIERADTLAQKVADLNADIAAGCPAN